MTKRLIKREKIDMFIEDAINKMFEIAGHDVTFDDIKDRKDEWYQQFTMTLEQSDEWVEWGVEEIRKRFRYTKKHAQGEMNMVGLMWSLSIRDL
jgi:hypothetical protein